MTAPPAEADRSPTVRVRPMEPPDAAAVAALGRRVYAAMPSMSRRQYESHLAVFPEGQLVAEDTATGAIVGAASSLIVLWDDYGTHASWVDFTDWGMFTNHDPKGHTLYGAELMVDPAWQGRGVGRKLYAARRALCRRFHLWRIRAAARIPGYAAHAASMSAVRYVEAVMRGELRDPVLSFQLSEGFHVLEVVADYLVIDRESRGYGVVIEWINDADCPPDQRSVTR